MRQVRDNTEQSRFEMDTGAGLAVADYRLNGSTMTIYHSEVPPPLRGQVMVLASFWEPSDCRGRRATKSCLVVGSSAT